MLFLKLLTAMSLIFMVTSCGGIKYLGELGKASEQNTAKDKQKTVNLINVSEDLSNKNSSFYLKQKINQIDACGIIKLESIDINNFIFTPEVDQCLSQSTEFYNYLLFLYKHNVRKANKQLQKFMENNAKKSLSLDSVVEIANKRLLVWLNRKSEVQEPEIVRPVLLIPNKEVTLEKNEFETTKEFKTRIANAKSKVQQAVERAEQAYHFSIKEYNKILASYNREINLEKKQRKSEARHVYLDILSEEIRNILGEPFLREDVDYDADKETFYATLLSTNSDWSEEISIKIPRAMAKTFKDSIEEITPILGFDINEQGELFVSYSVVRFDFQNYEAKVERRPTKESLVTERIQVGRGKQF